MNTQKRQVGRPIKPVLSRHIIAQHALAFVTEHGIERLTMNELAKELGVATSALYNHLDNKADLILLVQDALVSQVSVRGMQLLIEGKASLDMAIEDWARSYRTVFSAYPSLIPLIAVTPVAEAPQTSHMYDTVTRGLLSAGIPESQVINVVVAFESFLFGSALDVNAPTDVLDAPEEDVWLARAVAAAQKGATPTTDSVEAFENPPAIKNEHAEGPFQFGLRALIDQTVRLVAPSAPGPR